MNREEIRKQFETWADENQYALDRSDINKEIYRNSLTRNAWEGYQAALASKQENLDPVKQENVLSIYKQALIDIQNPIKSMVRNMPEGYSFNGHAAVALERDPQTYKDIASRALYAADKISEPNKHKAIEPAQSKGE